MRVKLSELNCGTVERPDLGLAFAHAQHRNRVGRERVAEVGRNVPDRNVFG